MIKKLSTHWKEIVLWLATFALAMASSFWRIFLPNYYSTPEIWAIWYKPAIALFLIPLFLGPFGFYYWFPKFLQQKLQLGSRPWLCCLILLVELVAVWVTFGRMLYTGGNVATAVVVSTLLFYPQLDSATVQKPLKWLAPSIVFLGAVAACSALLPWNGITGSYATALAVGLAYTAWLLLGVVRKGIPINRWWLASLPVALVFFAIVIQHAVLADAQTEVSFWQAGQNFYTAMRISDAFGSTIMNLAIPIVNLAFAMLIARCARPDRELSRSVRFLALCFTFITICGLMVFYCVVPAGIDSGVIMPYQTCFSSLPLGIAAARVLFAKPTQISKKHPIALHNRATKAERCFRSEPSFFRPETAQKQ